MTLSNLNLANINSTKRLDVQLTLASMKRFLLKALWLSKSNKYSSDTINRITADINAGNLHKRQMAQYVAASVILHCNDGWSYLGRSLSALLRGDPHRARHLAYYAELRGAMSLLASNGIGVFNKQHFVIDGAQ